MIAQRVHGAFAGQNLERREPEVVDGADRPAVAAVGIDELARHHRALGGALGQIAHIDAAGCCLAGGRGLGVERRDGRRADRSVLAAQQLGGLR